MTYEKNGLKAKQVTQVKQCLRSGGDALELENMRQASKAGHALLLWIRALVKYYDIVLKFQKSPPPPPAASVGTEQAPPEAKTDEKAQEETAVQDGQKETLGEATGK